MKSDNLLKDEIEETKEIEKRKDLLFKKINA
jgi:hypothetical protein